MPVSEISKGVFIVAPRDLPKYKDTAAGQYTSVFTKQRADQWEMAQKQALMEMELGTKRYSEEMRAYRERLAALDDRQKQLEKLKIDISEGRLRAQDAAEIAALREAGDRQRTAADFAAKKAEVITKSAGSTTTRTGGGGGGGGVKPTSDVSSGAQSAITAWELTTRGQALGNRMTSMARETDPGGTIITESESDRVNARGSIADREAASLASQLQAAGKTPVQARAEAEAQILAALPAGARADVQKYFDEVQPATAPSAGGGGATTTTTVRPGATTTAKRPGLGELPAAPEVARPETAAGQPTIQDINEYINNLEMAKLGLARPTMGGLDYITRSREVMQGRFGGFSGQPEALPFEQRNAAAELVSNQAYGLGQIEAYRDFLAKQKAAAAAAPAPAPEVAPTPAPAPVSLTPDQAALTGAAAADLLQSRRPSIFDGLMAPKTPQIPEIAALNIPRKPALTEPPAVTSVPPEVAPPVTPPSPAPPVPEAGPVAPVDIRPEVAALMTPDEIAAFKARLKQAAADIQLRRDLAAVDMGGTEINPAFRKPLAPPPLAARPTPPQFTPPTAVVQPVGDINIQRPPPPTLGTKEEAALNLSPPAMAPSTSGAAPRSPADVSAAVRPAGPLAGKFPSQVKGETERFAKSTEMAEDVRKATKAGIGVVGEQFGIKKGGPPSSVGYFQNRAEMALELVDKRNKLDRISNSGPGKLAKDIYMANSKDGKPFETTWQEIQLAFAGDPKGREAAHEVALALDIINREEKAAPKQAPQ
jgi:uncharacterized protein